MPITQEEIARLAQSGPQPAGPESAPQLAPAPGQYTEGDRAFFVDPTGKLVSVPQEQIGLAVQDDPTLAPASAEDVRRHKEQQSLSRLGAAGKELAASAVRGAGWVANLGMAGANLLGADIAPPTTEEYRAGANAIWAGLTGDDFLKAYDDSVQSHRDEEAAFPLMMAASRGAGDLIGMAASGGLSIGGAAGGAAKAAGLGRLGQAAAAVAGEGLEGGIQGLTSAFDSVANQPTREKILANGMMGAMLGAGLGAGIRGAAYGAERAANAVARHLPDSSLLRRIFGQPELSVDGFNKLVDEGMEPRAALARVLGKDVSEVTEAEAAHAADIIGGAVDARKMPVITAKNFDELDPANITDIGAAAHREAIEEGATSSIRRDLDEVFAKSREATKELREMPLKRELVAANFAADAVDGEAARSVMGERLSQIRMALGQTAAGFPSAIKKGAKEILEDVTYSIEKAEKAFRVGVEGGEAADGYIALDQLRRELLAKRTTLAQSIPKLSSVRARDQAQAIFQTIDQEYHGLADLLFNGGFFGRQGASQRAVNMAFVDAIPESKLAFRNFASQVGEEYGLPKYGADPDKLRSYLRSLNRESLRDENMRRFLSSQDGLMNAANAGYELSDKSRKLLEETQAAVKRAQASIGKAEDLMKRGEEGAKALAGGTATQGALASLGGYALGGPLGAAAGGAAAGAVAGGKRGAIVGAVTSMVPGLGYANTIRLAQKLRGVANSSDSAIVDSIASRLEQAVGPTKSLPRLKGIARLDPHIHFDLRGPGGAVGPFMSMSEALAENDLGPSRDRFKARREFLAKQNPETIMRAGQNALGVMFGVAPGVATAMSASYGQKLQNLAAAWPKTANDSLVPSRRDDRPASNDLDKSAALWQATFAPLSVFDDFKKGKVSWDAVEMLHQQWPDLVQTARLATVDLLQHLEPTSVVPDNFISQLDLFLKMEGRLDDTLAPGFMATMSSISQLAESSMPRPKPPRGNAKLSTAAPTMVGKMMG